MSIIVKKYVPTFDPLVGYVIYKVVHITYPTNSITSFYDWFRSATFSHHNEKFYEKRERERPSMNPMYAHGIDQIKRVQKKFTRMHYYKFKLEMPRPKYDVRLKRLKLHSLETRRLINDELVLFKVMHQHINTTLYQKLSFHQPVRNTRQNRVFYLPKMTMDYQKNCPLFRLQSHHDEYFSNVNIFPVNLAKFKRLIKNYFEF